MSAHCHLLDLHESNAYTFDSAVIRLLLQKCVHVLSGCDDMATFTRKSSSSQHTSEVKGQVSPMTKLGIGLTVRYSNIPYLHVYSILKLILVTSILNFIRLFPVFHSRYGEYLDLLESSPSSSLHPPSAVGLERALVRTRQLLHRQQHSKKKTSLSKSREIS